MVRDLVLDLCIWIEHLIDRIARDSFVGIEHQKPVNQVPQKGA
jgi:hypothetical protein